MVRRILVLIGISVAVVGTVQAESVEGLITVKKKLTKSRVTAALPLYQRGSAVELTSDAPQDPLSFERARTVIYLEGRHAAANVNSTLEQVNRRFSQDTIIIPAGSAVSFPNLDPIFHNVFSLSKAKSFDLGNYAKGDTRVVTFPEPGVVFVNCHLHPNMTAAIVVAPSQWIARANAEGHFTLKDVPPGDYIAVAWHRAAGFLRQQLKVIPGQNATLGFLVPLDDTTDKVHP